MYSYVGSYSISLFIFVLAILKYNNNNTALCYNKTMNERIPTMKPQQKSILLSLDLRKFEQAFEEGAIQLNSRLRDVMYTTV